MKKYSKYTALLMMCLMLVTSLSFTACNDDDFDTNQNRGGISLEVFGPCPVARGGELRFIGSGMNQINSVTIPGCDDITDIKVVSDREIRVTVPQTAIPGKVVLNHSNGKITTLTDITFLEPVSLDAENTFSPARVKPGQEVTINGEYLNLMKEVCFSFVEGLDSANVYAANEGAFIEHTRKAIKVIVPDNAVSGPVGVSDALAEIPNLIWSELELEVVLPSVASAIDITNAKPGDLITINGNDLELVRKVVMPNEDEVEYTVSEDGKKLTFNLPDNASDGAVCVVPGSGVKVAVANIGMVVPTSMTTNCGDGLRAAEELVIKGVNMDMVVSVVFPGMTDAVEPTSVSSTEVKVAVPATAWSGDLTLNLKSGVSVTQPIVLAHPENVAFAPSPVPGGAELTITGKNLDLIASVVFEGGASVEAKNATATELKIKVPFTAATGMVKFVLLSGETVDAAELTVDLPTIAYVIEWPSEEEEIKAGEIMKVTIGNEDKLTGVKVNGEDVQYILNGTTLFINLPMSAGNGTKITLMSGDESFEDTYNVIPATHVENVIFDTMIDLSWSGDEDVNKFRLYKESFEGVPVGAKLIFYVKPGEGAQIQINDANWGQMTMLEPSIDAATAELELTAEIMDRMLTTNDGWSTTALVIQGQNCIVNKVSLAWENPSDVTVWEGVYELAWGPHLYLSKELFDGAKAGASLTFYVNPAATGFQIQLNPADWKSFATVAEWSETVDHLVYTLTAEDLEKIRTIEGSNDDGPFTGMIIQGSGATLTKITFENN